MLDDEWAMKQRRLIDRQDHVEGHDGIKFKHVAKVRCSCNKLVSVKDAYRCYYCNKYFCSDCAPNHFGMTREQFRSKEAEPNE